MVKIFCTQDRIDFRPYVKKKIGDNLYLSIEDAITSGYLDVCRRPLQGINNCLRTKGTTSTEMRENIIIETIVPKIKELCEQKTINYDIWHRQLCDIIIKKYKESGYEEMTYGKAQKWINMSLKYVMLYTDDYNKILLKYKDSFHVPIDRIIGNRIAKLIKWLPTIGEKEYINLDDTFDTEKHNYAWSKINNYDNYLKCQKELREKLSVSPLRWEYDEWKKEMKK